MRRRSGARSAPSPRALTLHYNKMIFIFEPNAINRELARKQVSMCEHPDGRLEIRHEGTALTDQVFDKRRRVNQAAIVDHTQLGAVLAVAREM